MIAIADGTCMVTLLSVIQRFYHHESCGQCTPCREGMGWMERVINRIVAGDGRPEDIDTIYHISHANDGTTICSLGDSAGYAAVGIIDHFREEFEYYIANKRSMFDNQLAFDGASFGGVPMHA
jgi:NADH-quinone oxidoreductase subunit F